MSSNGPLIDADALRKKVSGTEAGSMPASLTCDSKLVIWATTRHGRVTGETNFRLSTATVSALAAAAIAASNAAWSASRPAVVVAVMSILAAPLGVLSHQASAVCSTETVMTWPLSAGRRGGGYRTHCLRAAR